MFFLGINTVGKKAEVVLLETKPTKLDSHGKIPVKMVLKKSWKSKRNEMEKIFPVLQKALKKIDAKSPELRIFVVEGPGHFTSLRIGVTVANTLGFILGAEITSMTTFDYWRAKLPPTRKSDTALVLQGGGNFFAVVTPGNNTVHRLDYEKLPLFFAAEKTVKYYAGDLLPKSPKLSGTTLTPRSKKSAKLPAHLSPSKLYPLSRVLTELVQSKTPLKVHTMVHPVYLAPPHITQSKQPVFAQH